MRRILSLSSLCVLLLSGCAGLQVPDVPICRPLDPIIVTRKDPFGIVVHDIRPNPTCMKETGDAACGYCPFTVSDKAVYVGEHAPHLLYGEPWSNLHLESLTLPTQSMAKIKGAFMDGCKKYGCSNADIAKWRIKIDSLDSVIPTPP